jgi:hypothetical protein
MPVNIMQSGLKMPGCGKEESLAGFSFYHQGHRISDESAYQT